ncbi:TPA: discoidin domain-containing protein, partial [Streptococcus suis]
MNRQDKNYQKLYQYSIRKRNWGVGSVVVGIFLAGMLQAPTVLANTDANTAEPIIENQADSGGGAEGSSEVAQPVAATSAPVGDTTTRSVGATETRSASPVSTPVRVNVPIDVTFNGASSVDGTNVAANAYDDDHSTYWTSDPNVDNTPEAPQYFVTKLKEPALVNQIDYTPRQANGDQVTGNISKMKLYSSQDGVSWELITPLEVLNQRGTVNASDKTITVTDRSRTKIIRITPVTAQYFRLEALLTEHWDTAQRNKRVTAAEFLPRGTAEKSSLDIVGVATATATSHDPNDGGNRPPESVIDNNNDTYWVSASNQNNVLNRQYLELTLESPAYISHVEYLPRQSGGQSTGNIKKGFIEYKETDSADEEWKRINVHGSDRNSVFTLGVGVSRKFIQFDPVIAKKIRLGAVETHHHEQQNRGKIVAAAEFTPYARKVLKDTVVTPIEKQEIRTPNPEMWVDDAEIVEDEGANGSTTVHKYYLTENGEKVGDPLREENGETIESRPRRVTYGTKERPTEEPQPVGGDTQPPSTGGDASGGDASSGDASGGAASGGDASGGDASGGDASGGDASGGDASGGDASSGDASSGDASGGAASGGDTSGSDASGGAASGGDASGGDASGGDASGGAASGGAASSGDASGGDASGGDASGGAASGGAASGSDASGGDASGGDASSGDGSGQSSPTSDTGAPNSDSQNVEDPLYVLGEHAFIELSKEYIQVTAGDATAWQNTNDWPRGVQNLTNGDIGDGSSGVENTVLTEMLWGGSKRMPQSVHFTFTELQDLEKLEIYKRLNNNGTLTQFSVTVYGENDQVIGEEQDVTVAKETPTASYSLGSFSGIKKVTVTFKQAVNASGQVTPGDLTVKGISFFKKDSGIRGTQVERSHIQVQAEDPTAFQSGYGVERLIDGSYSNGTELKWGPGSHQKRLEQKVIFNFTEPKELSGLTVYTRPDRQGTVAEYKVITKYEGQVVQEETVSSIHRSATLSNLTLNGSRVDSVELIFVAALDNAGARTNQFLTVREVKFYQAAPLEKPISENPDESNELPVDPASPSEGGDASGGAASGGDASGGA